jgi:hypothetical protein
VAVTRALFRAKKIKKAATPPRTLTTTPSKLKIPMFIPWAKAESDLPKQAAQPKTAGGCKAAAAPATAQKFLMKVKEFTGS